MRLFLTAALVLVGCGTTTNITNNTTGQTPTCSVTLSGAMTGTYDCKPATVVWSSSNNTGAMSFSVAQSSTAPAISLAIGWTGEPHTGHFTAADSGAQGGITVNNSNSQYWGVTRGGGSSTAAPSTYDINFTSVSNSFTVSTGKVYTTDGTIDATLVPLSNQTGNITVHVTF